MSLEDPILRQYSSKLPWNMSRKSVRLYVCQSRDDRLGERLLPIDLPVLRVTESQPRVCVLRLSTGVAPQLTAQYVDAHGRCKDVVLTRARRVRSAPDI